jgi:hypothetical protein
VRFLPWRAVPGHPRVTAWAALGSNEHTKSGFLAHAVARSLQGLFALESAGLGPLAPLGPEGDHALSGALRHERGPLALEGAYRSARETIEDLGGRPDTRGGEAGRVAARWAPGVTAWSLALERTDERVAGGDFFAADTLSRIAKTDRARVEAARPWRGGRGWIAATYGRETLESAESVSFPRRTAHLVWGAVGVEGALGGVDAEAVLGAGRYGGEPVTVAPSLRLERTLAAGMRAWAGAARGLGARLDPRAADEFGAPLAGDPPVLSTSTWLAGIGLERRSAGEQRGGDARGAWPRGSFRARGALYAGRSTPGLEFAREPLAVDGAQAEAAAIPGGATEFVALVAGAALAPLHGVRVELGGHLLGRSLDPVLRPSDPEWRVSGELEGREAFLGGDLDLRAGVLGEAIGPRAGTPAGDLPAAARAGVFAGFSLDDFHVRAEVRDLAGRNRLWPVLDATGLARRVSDESRFLLEARWTFWD